MGCAGSKLEDSNAIALCRRRSELLSEAIRRRYALAGAHRAYADSLRSVAAALQTLLRHAPETLSLPAQRKGDSFPTSSPSGSHIHFLSSDESDTCGGDSPAHFARSNPPPRSVSFEQQLESWDFFNPFEAFEGYYPTYTPSRSSKEVREEEDIPELEEDEAVEKNEVEEVGKSGFCGDLRRRDEERSNLAANSRSYGDLFEVGGEMGGQFERAAEAATDLDWVLEVGKVDYRKKRSFFSGEEGFIMGLKMSFFFK